MTEKKITTYSYKSNRIETERENTRRQTKNSFEIMFTFELCRHEFQIVSIEVWFETKMD